jgi:hypothetical protein
LLQLAHAPDGVQVAQLGLHGPGPSNAAIAGTSSTRTNE